MFALNLLPLIVLLLVINHSNSHSLGEGVMEQGSEHTCEYCEEVKKRNKDYIQCGKCEHFVALNGWRYHQESCLSQKELHYLTE